MYGDRDIIVGMEYKYMMRVWNIGMNKQLRGLWCIICQIQSTTLDKKFIYYFYQKSKNIF